MVRRVALSATVRTWVSLRTLQEQTIIGSPLVQIPISASSLKAGIHHDDGDLRFVPRTSPGARACSASPKRSFKLELKIGKHGHAYETTLEPSTRGVVDITQDVRLKLQILQSMLDYIADADDTG